MVLKKKKEKPLSQLPVPFLLEASVTRSCRYFQRYFMQMQINANKKFCFFLKQMVAHYTHCSELSNFKNSM